MSGNIREEGLWIPTGDPATVNETAASAFAPGQLGKVAVSPKAPNKLIQAVKRYATDTVALSSGGGDLAFWQDPTNYVVTNEPGNALGGTTAPIPAGVFLGSSVAAGNYGFIQVAGEATVRVSGSTVITAVGKNLVWDTAASVKQSATNANVDFPVVGVLKTLNTATTTNLSVSALLTVPSVGW